MKKKAFSLLLALLLTAVSAAGCVQLPATVSGQPAFAQPTASLVLLTDDAQPTAGATLPPLTLIADDDSEPVATPTEALPADPAAPTPAATPKPKPTPKPMPAAIDEQGSYTSRDDVALYLSTYGRLPGNFMTKTEARALGWSGGGLDDYAYGKCIGGDRFGNYEGLLPERNGRRYTECDIDTLHKRSRGAKRIIFSNDGLIYYTDDHYESFTLLYGEE